MSLFSGKKGLLHQFAEVLFNDANLVAATNSTNAMLFAVVDNGPKYQLFFDNQMDQEIVVLVEHPEAFKEEDYGTVNYKMLLTKISAYQTLSYNIGQSPRIQFDTGTKIYLHKSTVAPTLGKIKINMW